ncbi:UxaA family hydrolase [bacterium LRH843]|nr:UxaA family hydrolase [bacterium LRH843]
MKESNLVADTTGKFAFVIDQSDNVAVALTDLDAGETCTVRIDEKVETIQVLEDVKFGHKIALSDLSKDDPVYKYGEVIGKMKEGIQKGSWIHSHNMYCERGLK